MSCIYFTHMMFLICLPVRHLCMHAFVRVGVPNRLFAHVCAPSKQTVVIKACFHTVLSNMPAICVEKHRAAEILDVFFLCLEWQASFLVE